MKTETTGIDALPPLSPKQAQVYAYICWHSEMTGNCPTHQQISEKFDLKSPNSSNCHIKRLRKKGYLRPSRTDYTRTRIELTYPRAKVTMTREQMLDRKEALDAMTLMGQELGEYDL